MVVESAYAEMEKLNKQIIKHADNYFNKNKSVISDFAYDELVKRFKELKDNNPHLAELFVIQNKPVPIKEPGGVGLEVVSFTERMLSLDKAYTLEEVQCFINKLPPDTEVVYELKLDGLALEIEYENWQLASIKTRGDGDVGELVTHSLPLFAFIPEWIPKSYPSNFKVRGEAIVPYEAYDNYNEVATKQAKTPRNAVSGWIRASEKNQNKAVTGLLQFYVYWASDKLECKKYSELRDKLTGQGFNTPPKATLEAIEGCIEQDTWPADGIVGKVNSFEVQESLGTNNYYPLWAIAWKYPNEEKITEVKDVEWDTGKTGRVVPVVIYEPTIIGGVSCTRALLDNYYQFVKLELRRGSVITVSRNGDVIPRVNEVLVTGEGEPFKVPEECPRCASILELRKGKSSADLVCNNVTECPGQLTKRCVDLLGKKCLDVKGIGIVKIAELVDSDIINCTSDLLMMDLSRHVDGKVIDQLNQARTQPLYVIIKALGLPNVDITRAKKIANAWFVSGGNGDLLDWMRNADRLMEIDGISAGIALPIVKILENEDFNVNAINILSELKESDSVKDVDIWIKGCITGSLGTNREELIELFGDSGIELVDKLTKDCQFIITGEAPSKSKLLKATELGIVIVDGTKATSIEKLIETIKGIK